MSSTRRGAQPPPKPPTHATEQDADAARKAITKLKHISSLVTKALLTLGGGALIFTCVNVTLFAVEHQVSAYVAWMLDPLASLALITVLYVDGALSEEGDYKATGWPFLLRWAAGLMTWTMNCWDSLFPDGVFHWIPQHPDAGGILLHSVAPGLLILLSEAATGYRKYLTRRLSHHQAVIDLFEAARIAKRERDAVDKREREERDRQEQKERERAAAQREREREEREIAERREAAEREAERERRQQEIELAERSTRAEIEAKREEARIALEAKREEERLAREALEREEARQRLEAERLAAEAAAEAQRIRAEAEAEAERLKVQAALEQQERAAEAAREAERIRAEAEAKALEERTRAEIEDRRKAALERAERRRTAALTASQSTSGSPSRSARRASESVSENGGRSSESAGGMLAIPGPAPSEIADENGRLPREVRERHREEAERYVAKCLLNNEQPDLDALADRYGRGETWVGDRVRNAKRRLVEEAGFEESVIREALELASSAA